MPRHFVIMLASQLLVVMDRSTTQQYLVLQSRLQSLSFIKDKDNIKVELKETGWRRMVTVP